MPNSRIGGSGTTTGERQKQCPHDTTVCGEGATIDLPVSAANCFVAGELLLRLLQSLDWLVPLFRSLLGVLTLGLWSLLCRSLPGRCTPLAQVLRGPSTGIDPRVTHAIAQVGTIAPLALAWTPWTDRKGRHGKRPACRTKSDHIGSALGFRWFLFVVLGFGTLPKCAWGIPPEVAQAITALHATTADVPPVPTDGGSTTLLDEVPDNPAAQGNAEASSSAEGSRGALHPADHAGNAPTATREIESLPRQPAGVLPPAAQATATIRFAAYVVAPFYRHEAVEFDLQVPCEVGEAMHLTAAHLNNLALPYARCLTPASPQPCQGCQTVVAHPAWLSFSGLAAVVLDLRLCLDNQRGPITAAFVTRPTNLAELKREAGIFSIKNCDVYVGSNPEPLQEHEVAYLGNGCLVRFVPKGDAPGETWNFAERLNTIDGWPADPVYPTSLRIGTIMFLHSSGRYHLNCRPPAGVSFDIAAANFVGVNRWAVTLTASDAITCLSHRGALIRGVIAITPTADLVGDGTVIFLDFRQIAGSPQFTRLDSPKLKLDEIGRLCPRLPPNGWRLEIRGGRRRGEYLKVTHGETLVFGFVHETQVEDDLLSDPSTPDDDEQDQDDDDDQLDHESEEGEEERALSETSTRSRSRTRASPQEAPTSPDYSYEPGCGKHEPLQCKQCCCPDIICTVATPCEASTPGWPHMLDVLQGTWGKVLAVCRRDTRPVTSKVPEHTPGPEIFGDEWPRDTRLRALIAVGQGEQVPRGFFIPAHDLERPAPVLVEEVVNNPVHAAFLLYVPEYAAELYTAQLWPPTTVQHAIEAVQAQRGEPARSRFPNIIHVHPQPIFEFALLIAVPPWPIDRACVIFDLTRFDGRVFCRLVPREVNRASLFVIAGLHPAADVVVYVHDIPQPIPIGFRVDLDHGYCITITTPAQAHFAVTYLHDMLQTNEGWTREPVVPGYDGRWLFALSDGEPCHIQLHEHRRLHIRADIAENFGYEVARLTVHTTTPRITDFFDLGILATHVIIATQTAPAQQTAHSTTCYVLDLRPILQGLTWHWAEDGLAHAQPLVARLDAIAPWGFRTRVLGRRPVHTDEGVYFAVTNGEVLTVEFVPREPVITDAEESDSSDDSSSTDDEAQHRDDADAPDYGRPPRRAARRTYADSPGGRRPGGADAGPATAHQRDLGGNAICFALYQLCIVLLSAAQHYGAGRTARSCASAGVVDFTGSTGHKASPATEARRPGRKLCVSFLVLALALHVLQPCTAVQIASSNIPAGHGTDLTLPQASGLCAATAIDPAPGHRTARPIPTPCRRRQLPVCAEGAAATTDDGIPDLEDWSSLCTLLWQSAAEVDCQAFFLARTLLETLFDHFEESAQAGTCDDHRSACALSAASELRITDHVSTARGFDLTGVTLPIGRTIDDVAALFSSAWTLEHDLPEDLRLHPTTAAQWQRHIAAPPCPSSPSVFDLFPDGSLRNGESSWAFAVVASWAQGPSFVGFARGLVALEGQPLWIGASKHSAPNGELSAIFWALAWVFQAPQGVQCRIWSDCQFAVGQTAGWSGFNGPDLLPEACRAMFIAAEAAGKVAWHSLQHVKGHSGNPYNELADVLAKQPQFVPSDIPDQQASLASWASSRDLQWLWLYVEAVRHPHLWPTLEYGTFIDRGRPADRPPITVGKEVFFGSALVPKEDGKPAPPPRLEVAVSIVTANVQTLETSESDSFAGRVPYIREQLQFIGAAITGLQECRSAQSATFVSDTHIRYTSAKDEKGGHGVELWLSRDVPFAWSNNQPLFFSPNDLRLLFWDPRTIVARFVRGQFRLTIAVVHAPTAADKCRDQWWRDLKVRLWRLVSNDPLLLIGDFNARLTETVPGRIGDILDEDNHTPPEALYALLEAHDLWLPSTYSACHWGPSHTWISPGKGAVSRIDYVAIPSSWQVAPSGSYVLHDIDFGQKGVDHYGVFLHATWTFKGRVKDRLRVPRIDVGALADPAAKDAVACVCARAPEIAWSVDAHTHYQKLADFLAGTFAQIFPGQRAKCRQTFFTNTTWELRQQRIWLRKQIHRLGNRSLQFELGIAFRCMQRGQGWLSALLSGFASCLKDAFRLTSAVADLRSLKPILKKSIAAGRKSYLSQVAHEAVSAPVKDTVRKLRPLLGPPRRLQRGAAALPAVLLEDGTVAPDQLASDNRWLRHFSSIEDGSPCDPDDFAASCLRRQACTDLDALQLDTAELINRVQLEGSMRASPCNRACGNDNIPGELLHCHAASVARPVFQVFLKTAFRLEEPLQWKGGTLRAIWKQRGNQLECASYRAILVSSFIGKSVHGAMRSVCSPHLDSASMPLQIGGRREQPVLIASQAVRCFQQGCQKDGRSAALLFVDLQEAFHRVVRPLIHGGQLDDGHVAGIVKAVGLPPSAIDKLHSYVRESSLIAKSGATEWTARYVAEINADAWFTFGECTDIASVRGGTRPGDNLADLLFSFLFSEILGRLRDAFARENISVSLPWHHSWFLQIPESQDDAVDEQRPIDVTWMDDLAILLEATSAKGVVEKLRRAAVLTLDQCLQAILLPNLKAGKTEAIVMLRGRGSKQMAREVFRGKDPTLGLQSQLWPTARLRLVPSYKHLGSVIQVEGGSKRELKARIGAAWRAFKKHKKAVFASRLVASSEKQILFGSLVESTLCFGVGAWPCVEETDVGQLHSAIVAMSRHLLRPRFDYDRACHLGSAYVLAQARTLSAASAVHVERLRHFKSVARKATAELWAILTFEKGWLEAVQSSLHWLCNMLSKAGQAHSLADWDTAVLFAQNEPQGWKRQVRKARQTALLVELWDAEVQHFEGLFFRECLHAGAVLPADISDERTTGEVCGICGSVFCDLRSWSHHAFKVHGRRKPSRCIVGGTQCPVCLCQYRNNAKLCNHIEYSRRCRDALLNAAMQCAPEPGIGSKRFDDGHKVMFPATRASGPRGQWNFAARVDEANAPSQPVLSLLEDIFLGGEDNIRTYEQLLCDYRAAFASQCLQKTRLRATALQWQAELEEAFDLEFVAVRWMAWHRKAADVVARADFVEWLGGEFCTSQFVNATFRDARVSIPWLEFDLLTLPRVGEVVEIGFLIGHDETCPVKGPATPQRVISKQECQECPAHIDPKNWAENLPHHSSLWICCNGLGGVQPPTVFRSYQSLAPSLADLRLYSDFVRCTLLLWTQGRPTTIVLPTSQCASSDVLCRLAVTVRRESFGRVVSNYRS